jgi:CRISPR-associated protein Csm4
MNLETWNLSGSYFHFGKQGLGQEETYSTWSSDSLFAALTARLAILMGDQAVTNWIKPFLEGQPPFLLTSLFPFAGQLRFFPVPYASCFPNDQPLPEGLRPKDLKKVQFVSESIYRQLLNSGSLVAFYPSHIELHGGIFWLTKEEGDKLPKSEDRQPIRIWEIEKKPRVTIDRSSNSTALFHLGTVHFAPGCGLWFGVEWRNSTIGKELLAHLLNDLGEAGLGADRSVGYGKAQFTQGDILTLPDPVKMWTSLSRYLPREEEMEAFQHPHAVWKIQTVGGWLDSPQKTGQRRRTINFVQEGTTLGMPKKTQLPFGRVVDVRPRYKSGEEYPISHGVYRSGLTVAVGYGGEE